jgi:hypothetical protein
VNVHVCSDLQEACSPKLRWRLTDTQGKLLQDGHEDIAVPTGTYSVECPAISVADAVAATGRRNALLWIELENDGKVVSRKTVWFVRPKSLSLMDPHVEASVEAAGDGFDMTLKADRPALWAWVDVEGDPDARYSDNFIQLLPGRNVEIHVVPKEKMTPGQLRERLRVRSLFDTYNAAPAREQRIISVGADGGIKAPAELAEIIGNSAKLEAGNPSNVGGWSDAGDELDWSVSIGHAGNYRVLVDLACPNGVEGSRITVGIGGSQIRGMVPATGGWTSYKTVDLGIVRVNKLGTETLSLRATAMPHGNVMNLRSIRLEPVAQ